MSGLACFRRSRLGIALQFIALCGLILQPVPLARSYWTDSNGDGVKEWVDDPPPEDSWWNDDGDGDGWANGFEAVYGSDPYRLDSDFDGITDRDEHDLLPLNDPWHWDSDGDGFSDYDEYYNQLQGTPLSVDYAALISSSQPFYSAYDADGDGLHNPWDSEPLGFDRDGDGILNWQDSYMDDASNGSSPPPEGPPPDSDGDGISDDSDPYPYGSYWFNGAEYGGAWVDADGDGIPDPADAFPNGSFTYNGTEYEGAWSDMDNDSIPDVADPFPSQGGSYWYEGVEYGGTWADADGDGVPDPADPTPNPTYGGSYTYNGVEYPGPWSDADGDGVPDPADATPNGGYWYEGTEYPGTWADSDGDNVPDPADAWPFDYWNGQPHYSYNGTEYAGEFVDRDGDFIPDPADSWPDDPENGADDDSDGLDNYTERTVTHTLIDDVDSDNDYLTDSEEALIYHIDPNNPRSVVENQTVLDFVAVGADTDTDEDGLPDAVERVNAAAGEPNPDTWLDANGDLDADGYTNLQAYLQGWDLKAYLNEYDLDGDGITDVIEDYWNEIQPGILDKTVFADAVADPDGDGLLNIEEVNPPGNEPYHPGNATSVGRDVPIWHVWVDGTNYWVEQAGYRIGNDYDARFEAIDIVMNPVDGSGGTDTYAHVNYEGVLPASPVNPQDVGWRQATGAGPMWVYRVTPTDFDGDGMNDVWEHRHGLKLRHLNDASIDADNDGLANVAEFQHNTHPRINDSDGDGYRDGFEVEQGTRPDERTESPLTVVLAQIAQARALADEYRNQIVNRDTLSQRAQLWEEIQALLDLINAALAELAVESSDPGSVTDAQSSADHVDSDSGEEPPSMADVESRWVNSTYQGAHHIGVERWWIWSEEFQGWSPMGDISIVVDYDQPAGGGWSDSGGGGGDNGSVMGAINSTMFAPTAVYGPVPFDGWSVDGFYQLMPASGDTDPPPPDGDGTQDGEVTLTTAAETTPQEWSGGGREFRIVRTPEGDQSVPLSVVFVKGVGGNDLPPNASTTAIVVLALGPGEVASSSTVTIGAAPSAPNTSHSESVSLLPVEIKRDEEGGSVTWESLSGNMGKALPGQKINLKLDTSTLPQGVAVTDPHWSVTGGKFKDYTASKTKGEKTSLEQADFDQEVLHFYWSQPGSQTVTLNCKINGNATTVRAQINVVEPTSTITAGIGNVVLNGDTVELTGIRSGIVFQGRVDSLATSFGAEGEWNFVQLINNKEYAIHNNGTRYQSNHYGQLVLDTDYPYDTGGATGQNAETDDAPITQFGDWCKGAGTVDEFKMYLMFKPPGTNTKWVPLKVLDWFWKYDATKANGVWSLDPSKDADATSPGTSTHYHPEWDANVDPHSLTPQQ